MALLSLAGVNKRFGGVSALADVSFEVEQGEIVGLIGPNGAGKTTLLNCISGVFPLDGGTIQFDGQRSQALRRTGLPASASAAPFRW